MKKRMDQIKSNVSDIFELPKDIVMDLPKITIVGNMQVIITNHKGLIEYTKNIIRVNTNCGVLKIIGADMCIKTIITEEIIIIGNIEGIEFLY